MGQNSQRIDGVGFSSALGAIGFRPSSGIPVISGALTCPKAEWLLRRFRDKALGIVLESKCRFFRGTG